MSTSIYGSVEIKMFDTGEDDWYQIIDVGIALSENHDIFGCLFGVRNSANFIPLFEDRGAPPDCSEELIDKNKGSDFYKGLTWCTYQELLNIDQSELSKEPDQRVVVSENTKVGSTLIKRFPQNEEESKLRRHISRGEALDTPDFQQLMELMGVLAKRYTPEGVRMVVWFD